MSSYQLSAKLYGAKYIIKWADGQVQADREILSSLDQLASDLEAEEQAVGPVPAGLSPSDWSNGTGFYFLCLEWAEGFEPVIELSVDEGEIPVLAKPPVDGEIIF